MRNIVSLWVNWESNCREVFWSGFGEEIKETGV